MREFLVGVYAGLVSGVLTSGVVLFVASYWKRVGRPWIEDWIYQGTRIDGAWKSEVEVSGQKRCQHVMIEQRAYRVSGTITYPEDSLGHTHTYRFHGTFVNNVLTALAEEVGKARVDRGALLLFLEPGYGEVVMKGLGTWLEGRDLVTLPYRWTQSEPAHLAIADRAQERLQEGGNSAAELFKEKGASGY